MPSPVLARLDQFRSSPEFALLRDLDASTREQPPESVRLYVKAESDTLGQASQALAQLDTSLRRVAALAYPRDTVLERLPDGGYYSGPPRGKVPAPLPQDRASLRIQAAAAGSLELILLPVGALITLLASDPATALANAFAILDKVTRLRVFKGRPAGPLDGVSAEQALAVLREFNRQPENLAGAEPDADIELGDYPYSHRIPSGHVRKADGTVVSGRVVTLITTYPDGRTDYVHVEG